jgi:hypothetical protein
VIAGGTLGVGSFGIDLGDNDGRLRLEIVGEGFPRWGEGLAVCRPVRTGLCFGAVEATYGRTMVL